MDLIPIVSTKYLHVIKDRKVHMCLAHMLGKDDVYANFYDRRANDPDTFVILDNGACEGEMMDVDALIDIMNTYAFNELVVPDSFGNYAETMVLFHKHYPYLKHRLPYARLMAVVHGKRWEELTNLADLYIRKRVPTIGIPKVLTSEDFFDSKHVRWRLAEYIREKDSNIAIHFLGAGEGYDELVPSTYKGAVEVRSCDSALPFINAFDFKGILEERTGKITFEEEYDELVEDYLVVNLRAWKEI